MRKMIIALRGTSNCGKTTTIRLAYEALRTEGHCINLRPRLRKEVCAIVEVDDAKVGFASPGDKPDVLEENLIPLIEGGCAVIVCATHTTRSMTVDVVDSLGSRHGFERVWVDKPRDATDQDSANRAMAGRIVAKVRKAITGAQLVEV